MLLKKKQPLHSAWSLYSNVHASASRSSRVAIDGARHRTRMLTRRRDSSPAANFRSDHGFLEIYKAHVGAEPENGNCTDRGRGRRDDQKWGHLGPITRCVIRIGPDLSLTRMHRATKEASSDAICAYAGGPFHRTADAPTNRGQ